jgi:hypothetical protein
LGRHVFEVLGAKMPNRARAGNYIGVVEQGNFVWVT